MRALIALATVLLTGCASITPAAPASPPAPTLLASRWANGGLCPADAPCGVTFAVLTDGTWRLEGSGVRSDGALAADELANLADAVERTQLDTAPAFTGTCPIAWDGQEVAYTWVRDGRTHRISACDREASPSDPLVAALDALAADRA